ncbi:glycosyltransferase family 9 protein [Candidatus Pseudothioglobus singularis]|nr:glycosyltransferase family 9 protein [Candidatus Pseudothioglobus singularis]
MFLTTKIKAWLLRVIASKKETNFDIKDVKKILFLRYDRIGDMVITTPVFRELKLKFPKIKISVLASTTNQNILQGNPYVDEIFINSKNNLFKNLIILIKLRKKQFDVCVEFDHSVVPHAIIRLKIINPKKIISVYKEGRYGVKGSDLELYDFYTKKFENEHFKDIWLNTISPFGVMPKSKKYDLFCNDSQLKKAKNFISIYQKKILIGINLEGAVPGKKITSEKLEIICKEIYKLNNQVHFILLSSPNKYNQILNLSKQLSLSYVTSGYKTEAILDAAALIKKLDLVITPDTSIVHLASAFNIPIISIHENNIDSYQLFAPTSEINRTVFAESEKGIYEFSVAKLLKYCDELMKIIR